MEMHPYPGFSERLALIPFESPAIVGTSPCSDAVGSAGDFRGHAGSATGVAQTVRPQPGDAAADSQSARLSHSPHRSVRGKRNPARRPSAVCLLCNPRVASAAARTAWSAVGASVANAAAVCPPRRGSGGAGERRGEFFGPDVAGDAPVHLAESMRKRRPAAPFISQKPRRLAPEKARSELLPAPQRRTGSLSAIAQSENLG